MVNECLMNSEGMVDVVVDGVVGKVLEKVMDGMTD